MIKKSVTCLLLAGQIFAQESFNKEISTDEPIVVVGKSADLIGYSSSATQGTANWDELSQRPTLRRGELLEVVPGMVITQHAGGGKANQYFLRGFNLDHGTDFQVSVDGMPANYVTHAHGQGYADINFVMPELVERLDYFKGPYFAEFGDLSSAGGADYQMVPYLDEGIATVSVGAYDYFRLFVADSWELGGGQLTIGGEYTHEDGPFVRPNDYQRYNGFVKWYRGDSDNYLSVTGSFHDGDWRSSDQIASRAVESGLIQRYGAIDEGTGGETSRNTVSFKMKRTESDWGLDASAWVGTYALNLFSNFSYFTNGTGGDQFEQDESRWFAGGKVVYDKSHQIGNKEAVTKLGVETRQDWISDIGLYQTTDRVRTSTNNLDDVYQGSYGVFVQNELFLNERLRLISGLRGDLFYFDVESQDNAADTNDEVDAILSPKLSVAYALQEDTELYLSTGLGFHSNDARGVTASVNPVDPLVRTKGIELGARSSAIENLTATIGLWYLESDSELVYVGDEGTTEAGPASKRFGTEIAVYWRPSDHFTADMEYAWSYAQADVPAGEFDEIDNSVPYIASAGLTFGDEEGLFCSLRARYIGQRPLVGETRVDESRVSFQVNSRIGYKWESLEVSLDVLNLLDRNDRDVEYLYESRLQGEGADVEDIHYHPAQPRQLRANVTWHW